MKPLRTASSTIYRRISDYLYHQQKEMVDLLLQLAAAESPSTQPAAQQPILALLQQAFEHRGMRVHRVSGRRTGGHLLAVPLIRQPRQAKQLLLGHCDTVWPIGTLKTMPLTLRQGKLYGPGVYDMKAGLVLILSALEALLAHGLIPTVMPMVFINSDEEIGSRESTIHIQRLAQIADRALVLEPSLGPAGKLKTARKGVGHFTVEIIGKAAHAGLEPEKGASAILELSFIIQQLFALNCPEQGITVNVGVIDGGIRSNMVAPKSRADVDVRVLRPEDAQPLETAILNLKPTIPGTELVITGHIGRPPMIKTPRNDLLWKLAQQMANESGIVLEDGTAGGGSDGNTTSLYTATLDGLGAVGDAAHAPGEFVYVDQLVERATLLAQLLLAPPLKSLDTQCS